MALDSTIHWDVRTTGDDANGGGYDAVSDGGTDYSQQNSAQLSVSDGNASGTTNLNSSTGGFTSAMVDNILQISGGSLTAGFYQITAFTDTNNVTLDRTPGTGSGSTVNVGGALASPGQASGAAVGGNSIYVKDGTYTVTSTSSNVSNGVISLAAGASDTEFTRIEGYSTTHGDLGAKPKIIADGVITTAVLLSGSNNFTAAQSLWLDGNSQSGIEGCTGFGQAVLLDIKFTNFTDFACRSSYLTHCFFENCTASISAIIDTGTISYCVFKGSGTVRLASGGAAMFCVARDGTGHGFNCNLGDQEVFIGCVAYNCSSDGFNLDGNRSALLIGCIAESNGAEGYGTDGNGQARLIDCAGFSNTSGNYNSSNFESQNVQNFQAITAGSVFVDPANGDFNLNNTANRGATLRAITRAMPS